MKIDWDRVEDANEHTVETPPPTSTYGGATPDLDGRVPPPLRKTGDTGNTVVSTEALRTFARNLRQLKELLVEALDTVRGIRIAPGAFYHATELITKLTGSEGAGENQAALVPSIEQFLLKAIDALEVTALNLEQLAHDYDTTEELNGLTAVKLNDHFQDAVTYIGATTGIQITGLGGGGTVLPPVGETGTGTGGGQTEGDQEDQD